MRDSSHAFSGKPPRATPRISVSKLGEYMGASPSRRRAIIRDQREPREVKILHCRQARTSVASFLFDPDHDPKILNRAIDAERRQTPATKWQKQEIASNIEALQCGLDLSLAAFSGARAERPPADRGAISLGGVKVVVRPDLLLRDRDGRLVGAAKLYFVKRIPLSKESGAFVATALRRLMELAYHAEPRPELCLFVDVFAKKVHAAPHAFKKRMKDLHDACEEIAGRWANA